MTVDGIRIRQRVLSDVPLDALLATVAEPQRYVASEPRLVSARWLDPGGPRRGARGEVVTDMPFTVPLVRRLIGSPRGTVTVTEWAPPHRCACRFASATLEGELAVAIQARDGALVLDFDGVVTPRSRLAMLMLRPLRRQLERLASRSVRRGMDRMEQHLSESRDM